jgi:hypothetical protein
MEKLKSMWQWIVGVLGAIIGLLMLRNYFQRDLKADAKLNDGRLQDAVIGAKVEANAQAQQEVKDSTARLQERLVADQKEQANKTPAEIEAYWAKKK